MHFYEGLSSSLCCYFHLSKASGEFPKRRLLEFATYHFSISKHGAVSQEMLFFNNGSIHTRKIKYLSSTYLFLSEGGVQHLRERKKPKNVLEKKMHLSWLTDTIASTPPIAFRCYLHLKKE